MKKIIVTLMALAMTFSLVACGNSNTQSSASAESVDQQPSSSQAAESSQPEASSASQSSTPLESSSQESQSAESPAPTATETETGKTLVAYFSHSGNTRAVAENIHASVGGDIFEIKTIGEYPADYDQVLEVAQKEKSDNARPELNATIDNIESYDTIFIGYPNWWGDLPMAIYTFLDTYDLSGKTVVPFCTHGSSGLSDTVNSIKTAEASAIVLEGLSIRDSDVSGAESVITEWIASLDL